ncbi:MAG: protein kinase [Gemmataceae bacterium]|nr:protein kinase [Gemmataceae bacterium]
MPTPATVPEFLDLVRRSGLADGDRLSGYLDRLAAAGGLPSQPARVADLFVRDALLTKFQAEQLLQGKWKRFTLGKYKVLERLGSGGMGHVFLCEHILMRRRVAVKVLPIAKAADRANLERFYREARAVAAVDHPNIVRAFDIDHDDQLHFLVMEYVDGTNLQDLVKRFGPLDVTRACHYAAAAALGLQHAHEIGLIHRDVKPGNVLVDRSGAVKVLDLGLARFFHDPDDALTRQNDDSILGTADYLSPEQAEDSHAVDIRTDIYSLGATLYYLLTGGPPYPEGTVPQKLIWLRTRHPRPVREVRPGVPDELAAVVARMMAKDPAGRYQTPAEVVAALTPWTAAPILPPPDHEMPRLSPAATGSGSGPAGRTAIARTGSHAVPPRLAAPVADAEAAVTAGGTGVWDALDDPDAATVVAGRTSLAVGGPPPTPSARPERRPRVGLWATATAILVVATVGGYFLFAPGKKPNGDAAVPATTARRLVVSRANAAGENTFGSLDAALRAAAPGDTVVLMDDRLTDPGGFRLDRRTKNLTIESGLPNGRPAVIEYAAAGVPGTGILLDVTNADGLKVRNIEFDGRGLADVGVQLTGATPGVTFEGVTVRGVKTAGFRLVSVAGDPSRPVVLDRVRVILSPETAAGVWVESRGPLETKRVTVRNSRFEGPGKAGLRFDGAVGEAEVTQNRFYLLDAAIVLGRPPEGKSVRVQVAENTIYGAKVGVLVPPPPPGPVGTFAVAITRNYFAKVGVVGQAEGGPAPGVNSSDNGADPEAKPGTLHIGGSALITPVIPPPNPADDRTFLRFPPDAKVTVGAR